MGTEDQSRQGHQRRSISPGWANVVIGVIMVGTGSAIAQDADACVKAAAAGELAVKAEQRGSVAVIVELRVAYRPEGALAVREPVESSARVVEQRLRIARAQDRVLVALEGSSFGSVKRFVYTPQMALTVDTRGLGALVDSKDVLSIVEDAAVPATMGAPGPGCRPLQNSLSIRDMPQSGTRRDSNAAVVLSAPIT